MVLIFSSWQVLLEIQLATLQMLHNRQAYSLADVSICDKVSRNIRRKASAVEKGSTLYPNEFDPKMARDTYGFQLLRLDEQVLHRLLLGVESYIVNRFPGPGYEATMQAFTDRLLLAFREQIAGHARDRFREFWSNYTPSNRHGLGTLHTTDRNPVGFKC